MKTFVFFFTIDRKSAERCFLYACYGKPPWGHEAQFSHFGVDLQYPGLNRNLVHGPAHHAPNRATVSEAKRTGCSRPCVVRMMSPNSLQKGSLTHRAIAHRQPIDL